MHVIDRKSPYTLFAHTVDYTQHKQSATLSRFVVTIREAWYRAKSSYQLQPSHYIFTASVLPYLATVTERSRATMSQIDVYTEPAPKPADIPVRIYSNPICPFAQVSR